MTASDTAVPGYSERGMGELYDTLAENEGRLRENNAVAPHGCG